MCRFLAFVWCCTGTPALPRCQRFATHLRACAEDEQEASRKPQPEDAIAAWRAMHGNEPFDWELFGVRTLKYVWEVLSVTVLLILGYSIIRSAVLDALTEGMARGFNVPPAADSACRVCSSNKGSEQSVRID